MNSLTTKQKKYIKSLAHTLKPVVLIGKQGLTNSLLEQIRQQLDSHELIKIKLNDSKEEREEIGQKIEGALKAHVVGLIGHTLILFRENPDPLKRKIKAPKA
jgi:RNA-binding protein